MTRTPTNPARKIHRVIVCYRTRVVTLLASAAALILLSACGGSNNASVCAPGLISGFNGALGNDPLNNLAEGAGGEGVGGGDGVGIGGADGQYRNVDVTVETAGGQIYGPKSVDDTKGMVTFVGCSAELPIKVTFEGTAVDAIYYDEGLKAEVSFFNRRRIGLISTLTKNAGVTPLSHALFDRAMEIGRIAGNATGWKDPLIVSQAHAELLAIINDQLPQPYQIADIRALPIPLNATNDRVDSNTLADNENGVLGALMAGLAKTARTTLPNSSSPALDIADVLIRDLADAKLDLKGTDGQLLGADDELAYTFDTLWTQTAVSTGDTAQINGVGNLRTENVAIAYVRSSATGQETEYVIGSNGELVTVLNPTVNGGDVRRPASSSKFSEVMGFGSGLPVVALRRDGLSVLVFKTPEDGSVFSEVFSPAAASGATIVELMDGGSPVIRTSDGKLWRINAADNFNSFNHEPTPPGVINFTFRPEYQGAIAPGDSVLGADPNGAANNGLCIGASRAGKVKLWRPVFAPNESVPGRDEAVDDIVQVSSNQQVSLGLRSDGKLFHLDANHSVGDTSLSLVRPESPPVEIVSPKLCWLESPYALACNGDAYEVTYPVFSNGSEERAGAISGITKLPIPASVWRTRSNRGANLVFLGDDGKVYNPAGQELSLPL